MFEIDTKRKVTRSEYNKWIRWLRARGYSGPFAGLTTSNECVKLLYKELRKVPPTILETRPRDKRTISSNLTKYGRRREKGVAEDSYSHIDIAEHWKPDQRHYDHWQRLGRIAEELKIGLGFPKYIEGEAAESRFGGIVWGNWGYSRVQFRDPKYIESPEVHFSAEKQDSWDCLIKHMDAEFPTFSSNLKEVHKIAVRILNKSPQATIREQPQLRSHPKVRELNRKLWLIIERGTFKGTCEICDDWT